LSYALTKTIFGKVFIFCINSKPVSLSRQTSRKILSGFFLLMISIALGILAASPTTLISGNFFSSTFSSFLDKASSSTITVFTFLLSIFFWCLIVPIIIQRPFQVFIHETEIVKYLQYQLKMRGFISR